MTDVGLHDAARVVLLLRFIDSSGKVLLIIAAHVVIGYLLVRHRTTCGQIEIARLAVFNLSGLQVFRAAILALSVHEVLLAAISDRDPRRR